MKLKRIVSAVVINVAAALSASAEPVSFALMLIGDPSRRFEDDPAASIQTTSASVVRAPGAFPRRRCKAAHGHPLRRHVHPRAAETLHFPAQERRRLPGSTSRRHRFQSLRLGGKSSVAGGEPVTPVVRSLLRTLLAVSLRLSAIRNGSGAASSLRARPDVRARGTPQVHELVPECRRGHLRAVTVGATLHVARDRWPVC